MGALIHDTGEPELKKKLEPIYNNARRLLNLVNQLLDFRKLEMKGERLRLKMNDMVFFLEEAVRQFTDLAASREIELSFEPKVERLFMNYDSDKMYKMLNNLLSNAFKFISIAAFSSSISASSLPLYINATAFSLSSSP